MRAEVFKEDLFEELGFAIRVQRALKGGVELDVEFVHRSEEPVLGLTNQSGLNVSVIAFLPSTRTKD